ncbi:MAG: tryptophan--tRNA ligase [Holosporales bacterium]|jgi:tryptophanyl-tRNA synthetase|nr:tryptophan--tRNA ligase [Holosporales bacterium]
MKKVLVTGDRPSGKLHLGHYVGSLLNRVKMQADHETYIMIADVQALTDHFATPDLITKNVHEITRDYLSVGINPELSNIYIQSQIPEIAELTIYYMNLVTVSRLERNPTIKTEIAQKNMEDSILVGFLCYPINQAADITILGADIVPTGEDQFPMIEQTNEIVRKFNRIYNTNILKECSCLVGSTGRLPGIDGKKKASKSLGNAISLADDSTTVKEKIWNMFTDPNHLKVNDKGRVEGNVVFTYLDIFHENKDEVSALKDHYQKGGLGDVKLKSLLYEDIESVLTPIREKRQTLTNKQVIDVLQNGTQNARKKAQSVLHSVRNVIGFNY